MPWSSPSPVVTDEQQAIDPVLVTEIVVNFRDPVVAGVEVGEGTDEGGAVRMGSLDEAAGAG